MVCVVRTSCVVKDKTVLGEYYMSFSSHGSNIKNENSQMNN